MGWRIIIIYDGSSHTVDATDSIWRSLFRKLLARYTSAFVTNSSGGKEYLLRYLLAREHLVYHRPYEVPDISLLTAAPSPNHLTQYPKQVRRPLFLFVGQLVKGKGLHHLFLALLLLKNWDVKNFTLMVIGDGPQRTELEDWARRNGLDEHIVWLGWLEYGQLGFYFQHADVLVFPTLADVWGMVVLEAMLFGKPILCSKFAGAADLVENGQNGFIFDPTDHKTLAEYLKRFIDNPKCVDEMGARSKKMIEPFTAQTAAHHLADIATIALDGKQSRNPAVTL
jgi:glycosyltransferase involved in cell wall biosynthesis